MKKIGVFAASLAIFLSLIFNLLILAPNCSAGEFLDLGRQEGFTREGGNEIAATFGQRENPEDIRVVVARIIQVALSLIGIIFTTLLILAGFKYMTAGGNESQVSEAKQHIVRSLIGLTIILASLGITVFVIDNIEGATNDSIFIPRNK